MNFLAVNTIFCFQKFLRQAQKVFDQDKCLFPARRDEVLSSSWYKSFLRRHPEAVAKKPRKLEKPKVASGVVRGWLEKLQSLCATKRFPTWGLWNMNEKPVQIGGNVGKVVTFERSTQPTIVEPSLGNHYTLVFCISAEGDSTKPTMFLPLKTMPPEAQSFWGAFVSTQPALGT